MTGIDFDIYLFFIRVKGMTDMSNEFFFVLSYKAKLYLVGIYLYIITVLCVQHNKFQYI